MKAFLIFLIFLPASGFAKTIFEPSLSLNSGAYAGAISGSDSITNGTEIEAAYTTFSGGFRYGITRRYVHVTAAVDAYMVNMSTDQNVEADSEIKANVGLGVGYEWNIPLRTYIILGFPFSSLEVGYYFSEAFIIGLKYTRMEMGFAGAELNVNTFGVAVSFPIEFEYPEHWWRKTDWE